MWDLLSDNDTAGGRAATSALVVVVAVLVGWAVGALLARRTDDRFSRYYVRRVAHFAVGAVAVIALAIVWRPFAGRIGLVVGLTAAALGFAFQEVFGAWAGWINILSGRVYRIGDRIEIGEVRGDVVDITPLRTRILEIGTSSPDAPTWVQGRQLTGRVVAVSNKKTFTEPVFNYSAELEFIWEELRLPIAYGDDWRRAAEIMEDEAHTMSDETAQQAVQRFTRKYPVRRADVSPRVYTQATDNYVELSARFPVPVRNARLVKDEMTRRIVHRFEDEGIEIASTTQDVTVHSPDGD